VSAPLERVRRWAAAGIWDVRLSELPAGRAALTWGARVVSVTARGFLDAVYPRNRPEYH